MKDEQLLAMFDLYFVMMNACGHCVCVCVHQFRVAKCSNQTQCVFGHISELSFICGWVGWSVYFITVSNNINGFIDNLNSNYTLNEYYTMKDRVANHQLDFVIYLHKSHCSAGG